MPQTDVGSGAMSGVSSIPHRWIAAIQSPDGSMHLDHPELSSALYDRVPASSCASLLEGRAQRRALEVTTFPDTLVAVAALGRVADVSWLLDEAGSWAAGSRESVERR